MLSIQQESMSPLLLGGLAESIILKNPLESHGKHEDKTNERAAKNIKQQTGIESMKNFVI